jgi:hypothetical protein
MEDEQLKKTEYLKFRRNEAVKALLGGKPWVALAIAIEIDDRDLIGEIIRHLYQQDEYFRWLNDEMAIRALEKAKRKHLEAGRTGINQVADATISAAILLAPLLEIVSRELIAASIAADTSDTSEVEPTDPDDIPRFRP